MISEHRVVVRLTYVDPTRTEGTVPASHPRAIPYKWLAECACGAGCISWQWIRSEEEGGGGAYTWALEHLESTARRGRGTRTHAGTVTA